MATTFLSQDAAIPDCRTLATAPPLQRPPRDTRLDLLRGWLQLQIFASHATGSFVGAWLITAAWGLSDSSEQFVFLSGFSLASVFVLKSGRGGWRAGVLDLLGRLRRLHLMHLMVFSGFAVMVIAIDLAVFPGEAARTHWTWLLREPWLALPAAAGLVYQPDFMGILPLFLACMALLPAFVWGMRRFGAWALLPPAILYATVQATHLIPPGLGGTEITFNPFAWQFLFLVGAWFGRQALLHGRAIRYHPWFFAAAVAMLAFGIGVRLIEHGLVEGFALDLGLLMDKQHLALPRLLHALSLAYVVAVLVPPRPMTLRSVPAEALAAVGRNSLNIFCLGLFVSYAAATVFRLLPDHGGWLELPLVGGGAAMLLALAWRVERRRAAAA